jgi:hypothetical protein
MSYRRFLAGLEWRVLWALDSLRGLPVQPREWNLARAMELRACNLIAAIRSMDPADLERIETEIREIEGAADEIKQRSG